MKRLFIANRGEIARRIALTAKRLGIETVVVVDREDQPRYLQGIVSKFVKVPEENVALYLNPHSMVTLARNSGCDGLHPGFGFLSENAEFAQMCLSAGLIWVGPNPAAIQAMASKSSARIIAEKAKVPCVPGLNGIAIEKAEEELLRFAKKVGFPLLLKASYGGGGKGMRIVRSEDQLLPAAKLAASEGLSSFGNSELIAEKYLERPRHVEVQVLGDKHGQIVILGDRDCSFQRRHQKVLEEAPAPNLSQELRRRLAEAARNLAAQVKYDSTGTVEFMVVGEEFFFLEMNTRLQVEHTVTEEIYRVDLVEWQIRVASQEKLSQEVLGAVPQGHSVEVRLYAEDPVQDFFPAPGKVHGFLPFQGPGIRWEVGLDVVDEISTKFDPMVGKLIATGKNRDDALSRLKHALKNTCFLGPNCNLGFLLWSCEYSDLAKGPATTALIQEILPDFLQYWQKKNEGAKTSLMDLARQVQKKHARLQEDGVEERTIKIFSKVPNQTVGVGCLKSPESRREEDEKRSLLPVNEHFRPTSNAESGLFKHPTGRWSVMLKHEENIRGVEVAIYCGLFEPSDGGAIQGPFWAGSVWGPEGAEIYTSYEGCSYALKTEKIGHRASTETLSSDLLVSPVPGKIIKMKVKPQEKVEVGNTILILESMKMQFEVKGQKKGTFSLAEGLEEGSQVVQGQELGRIA